jgi:hypothetical protein
MCSSLSFLEDMDSLYFFKKSRHPSQALGSSLSLGEGRCRRQMGEVAFGILLLFLEDMDRLHLKKPQGTHLKH